MSTSKIPYLGHSDLSNRTVNSTTFGSHKQKRSYLVGSFINKKERMKHFFSTLCLLVLLVTTSFGQSDETTNTKERNVYVLFFDGNDVSNWEDFYQYVKNITQAVELETEVSQNKIIIHTYRTLDPKVVKGKLTKYGVNYISFKNP